MNESLQYVGLIALGFLAVHFLVDWFLAAREQRHLQAERRGWK